jgi:hypothetical protein
LISHRKRKHKRGCFKTERQGEYFHDLGALRVTFKAGFGLDD